MNIDGRHVSTVGQVAASARSRSSATCPGRRPCGPKTTPSCLRSSGMSSSPRSPATGSLEAANTAIGAYRLPALRGRSQWTRMTMQSVTNGRPPGERGSSALSDANLASRRLTDSWSIALDVDLEAVVGLFVAVQRLELAWPVRDQQPFRAGGLERRHDLLGGPGGLGVLRRLRVTRASPHRRTGRHRAGSASRSLGPESPEYASVRRPSVTHGRKWRSRSEGGERQRSRDRGH